jgi:hypothetical protein
MKIWLAIVAQSVFVLISAWFDATGKAKFSKEDTEKIGACYDETCTLICTLIYLYFSFSAMNEKTKTNLT